MYHLSNYNFQLKKENGNMILYNTYTQALTELDTDTYPDYTSINLNSPYAQNFIDMGYWVNYDELEEILSYNKELSTQSEETQVVLRLTDACNFRCPYCYQDHKIIELDTEKREIIKKFLSNIFKLTKKLSIHYFGGEPLLNIEGILEIDSFVTKNWGEHNATITTNAFLLNEDVIRKLQKTSIRDYQITLDGPKSVHDKTRILADGSGTFSVLIQNIRSLLSLTDSKVRIRFNCSKENASYAEELLNYLYQENILQNPNVYILFQELHNYTSQENFNLFFHEKEYFTTLLKLLKLLQQYHKKVYRFGPIYNACALYQENAYIIGPDLSLESCTSEEKKIGRLSDDGSIIYNEEVTVRRNYYTPDPKCYNCILLPMCMSGCPLKRKAGETPCLMDIKDLPDYIYLLMEECHAQEI